MHRLLKRLQKKKYQDKRFPREKANSFPTAKSHRSPLQRGDMVPEVSAETNASRDGDLLSPHCAHWFLQLTSTSLKDTVLSQNTRNSDPMCLSLEKYISYTKKCKKKMNMFYMLWYKCCGVKETLRTLFTVNTCFFTFCNCSLNSL